MIIVAGTLLAAGTAAARPAYVDQSPRPVYAPPAYAAPAHQRTFVPGHWEQRGPHRVWVEAQWVVTPRYAGHGAPQWQGGPGPRRDRDRDGIPDRFDRDRDGDGVPNHRDRAPDNPRWR
ncbi:hypothetical protein PE066_02235 [Ramlibacter tataouinensis]|uniref:hypothetical protein n=1 Tax=Ramlibacter tataouinensis TaxID=94132 RepID=UPI0022F3C891|nr:hypothetical protein [Ramlibacter tataouinensis]WBY02373.1 hypothetical protein PE066_02235 [Ramlibacter tataouinensis]